MLDWLKRIATPSPGERSATGQNPKEHRLERLLGRLETETVLHHPDPAPQPEGNPAGQPAPGPVARIDPVSATDSKKIGESADELLELINRAPGTESKKPGEPADDVLDLVNPLPTSEPKPDAETTDEPAWEALDETPREPVAPRPRTGGRKAKEPVAEAAIEIVPPPPTEIRTAAKPAPRMFVIAVSSQKGGSGKTTLAAHLAVRADAAGHGPVVLIDTDPQGSLAEWWHARAADTPVLATVKPDQLAANLAELRSYGTAVAIIDTPPALTGSIERVIAMADLIIIPARPSPHDLRAAGGTVEMCRRAGKAFMFVVNGASPRASITAQAVAALSEHGRVAPVILYQRTEYAASMIDGRTVMEAAPSGRSAQEIAELWQCVYAQFSILAAA